MDLGRVVWSSEGLHVGLELPAGLALRTGNVEPSADFDSWFLPGTLYMMLNPSGDRALSYSAHDRCVVLFRDAAGRLTSSALVLRTATLIESSETPAAWVQLEEAAGRILVTIAPEGSGLGALHPEMEMGFNIILIGADSQVVSWVPLTRRFSWDQPSAWGLLTLSD